MAELLGEKIIYQAIKAWRAEPEMPSEVVAYETLLEFNKEPLQALELKTNLAKAIDFILSETIDQQG